MVYVFVHNVVKCVEGTADTHVIADFAQEYSKCSELKKIYLGFEGNGKFRKISLQPPAHNSILPMSVDTLPLKLLHGKNKLVEIQSASLPRHQIRYANVVRHASVPI